MQQGQGGEVPASSRAPAIAAADSLLHNSNNNNGNNPVSSVAPSSKPGNNNNITTNTVVTSSAAAAWSGQQQLQQQQQQFPPAAILLQFQQLQHLWETGQISDPRYKQQLVTYLQTQQAAGNFQGIGSSGGSSGGGPPGPLPPSNQQRLQQDVIARNTGDAQGTSLGLSDSSHGLQSHSQAAFLQHALLSAQQKAQANAYTQQKAAVKPVQAGGATRDFNSANNLNLQELMHQQLAGRQLQQPSQTGTIIGGQSNASEKPRNQARTSSQHHIRPDSNTLAYPHGSFQRPTSGPVQGVSNHQQRVQNSSNAQFSIMAPSLQQASGVSTIPANTTLPQGQIPPQFLPQYQAHLAAMQKAGGQGGVVMAQSRPTAISVSQMTPAVDQGRVGTGGAIPMLMTSGGLASGGFPNSGAMPVYLHPMHGGNSSMSVATAPDMNSNFLGYHATAQAGDSRAQMSTNMQANSGGQSSLGPSNTSLSSGRTSNLDAAVGETADKVNSGSSQHFQQQGQPQISRPSMSVGVVGESFVPGQQSRHPPAQQQPPGFGFSKYQLTLLRNQILAFKKLRARKPGDVSISDEIKRLINPAPRSSQHTPQVGGALRLREQGPIPVLNANEVEPQAKVATEPPSVVRAIDTSLKESLGPKDPEVRKELESRNGESQAGKNAVVSTSTAVNNGEGHGAIAMKQEVLVSSQVKPEPAVQQSNLKVNAKDIKLSTIDSDKVKASAVSDNMTTTKTGSVVAAAAILTPPTIQKAPHVVRPYRGPLFDFPPVPAVGKRVDGGALSLTPQANLWGPPISLGYKVRELLLEEGVRVIDRKRAEKLKNISDVLTTEKGKKLLKSYQVVKLRIEEKKLRMMELQARVRDEVEEQQQEIMAMGERAYRKFVRLCERQRLDLARQVMMLQRSTREKHLKSLLQWRKKLLESQWSSRDGRITRNRGVAKYHERMLREFSKRKDEDRNKRMEALKNNDVDAYREMLRQQQSQLPGDAGERFEVLSSFLTQTEEYLHKLGGKISAVKNHQEREEAALAAAASARAQGYSEEEVEEAAVRAGEEASVNGYVNRSSHDASVNKYYSLAHAVNEKILRQPSMLRAGTLRDYQMVGLQWMLSLYNNRLNGILADEMGLGKTVQVMALIAYLMEFKGNYGPHLIIVPNAVIVNWKSELLRWLPSVSCIYYVGHKDQRAKIFAHEVCAMKFNVLVTTYEFIMRDRSKLSKVEWKYLIIDEAQRMKDRESRLARDLDRFRCHRRLLLTGTPLQNDLHELWSLLNLLLPEVFDNSKSFHEWFAKPFQKESVQTEEDDWLETEKKVIVIHRLHQILEPFMLRRRVEDVEGSLPPKVSVVLKCKMSAYQAAIYDWVKTTGTLRLDPDDEAQRIAGNSKRLARAYAPLQNKCMELRKVCNHPYLNYPPRFHVQGDQTVRACGKLWILDRILVKLHKTGHRVLLFSTMTRLLDILEDYLQWRRLSYRRIDGMTTLDARESAIVEFNRPGSDCFIFLLSIRAAGRGLNLQTADTVIVYDPDPNPKNEEQAVARAHRIGQKREVRVIYMEAVVESLPSYQKEDELRSGGSLEEDDDEMAGKDRYVGSVESLVRNNIQQHKIDMADEVINAGRFDQRTTQEERRLTLEALLHDEERYQQTVHDVPTLQEVNRMIARTDEELELFDQMDEEWNWAGDLIPHQKVPKWLRVGSREVNAAVEATSKETMKKGFLGAVGTQEAEDQLAAQGSRGPLPPKVLGKRSKSTSKYKNYREVEMDDDFFPVEEVEEEEEERESVIEEVLTAANADDEEEEEGEIEARNDQDEAMMDQEEGEDLLEEEEIIEEVIEEVEEAEEGEDEQEEEEEEAEAEEGEVAPELLSSDEGEVSPVKSQRGVATSQSKKFASLSALESRPSRPEETEDLEEGEIAASGDSEQRSESWMEGQEEVEEVVEEEEDHAIQVQKKRKRSRSHHRRIAHIDGLGERETSNGSFSDRDTVPSLSFRLNSRVDQRSLQWSNSGGADSGSQLFERSDQWGATAKKRSMNPPEVHAPARPRIVFKHSWVNGQQEPVEDPDLGRDNRTSRIHAGLLGSWGGGGGRLPEGQQKKCKAVLGKLHGAVNKEGRQIAALFMELPKRIELPDYYKVIGRPISAQAIEERLDRFDYPSVLEFAADVHLMIDNAARFHSSSVEVQADARRLQALFEQRMGLMFPEVDFSSARVKTHTPAAPPQPPVVTGPRGIRRPVPPPADTEPTRQIQSEPPNPRSSTRISLVRQIAPPQDEAFAKKQEGKKSKKAGKEKTKDKKVKSKSKSKSSIKEKELVVEEAESDEGILHPVDLVIHKKKRQGREHTGSRTFSSHLVLNSEEPRDTTAQLSSIGPSGKSRSSQHTAPRSRGPASAPASSRRTSSQPDSKVSAVTVLKKSRTDGGKRRPSHP